MIAYILMLLSNLRFHAGLKAQGIDVKTLPFKSWMTRTYLPLCNQCRPLMSVHSLL